MNNKQIWHENTATDVNHKPRKRPKLGPLGSKSNILWNRLIRLHSVFDNKSTIFSLEMVRNHKLLHGVQPWALAKFPDFSLTFPWPFCGFPWPWDILSAFHYCLNTNFASNLTNHSPKVAITKLYQLGRLSKYKIWCFKLSQDCAQWQPSELNTLEEQTVLWFFIISY